MKLFENNDHFGAAASGHAGGGLKSITFILMALGPWTIGPSQSVDWARPAGR